MGVGPEEQAGERVVPEIDWRVTPRPWSYGYENGYENFGGALAEIREEMGFATTEDFSSWLYEEGQRTYGPGTNLDLPPVLLDAFEYPALGWEQSHDVIEAVAQALRVSPGTLLDELWLRASKTHRGDGSEIPDGEQ